jgi:hypothetical protein
MSAACAPMTVVRASAALARRSDFMMESPKLQDSVRSYRRALRMLGLQRATGTSAVFDIKRVNFLERVMTQTKTPAARPGFVDLTPCYLSRSVLRNNRAVEVIVQAGAEDVLGNLALADDAGNDRVRSRAEIDIEIFGLRGPVRSEQAKQLERGLDASASSPAALGGRSVDQLRRPSALILVFTPP